MDFQEDIKVITLLSDLQTQCFLTLEFRHLLRRL